jgi:hypothetical protein
MFGGQGSVAVSSKAIGLLTSGGDCAGLNAVIRAVAIRAIQGYGWRVYGIRNGTMGLRRRRLEVEALDLSLSTVNILRPIGAHGARPRHLPRRPMSASATITGSVTLEP